MSDFRIPLEDPRFLDGVARLLGISRELLGVVNNEIRYNGRPLTPDQYRLIFAVIQMGAEAIKEKGGFKTPEAFKEITRKFDLDTRPKPPR
jgi:hypothetical protein